MNAFVVFCCILILLFILEAQHRANLVITDAKVKHIPPTTTVPCDTNCVQKDGMTHKYLQSDTSFKDIYYAGKNICRCCGNMVYLYTMLMHRYRLVHNAVSSRVVRWLYIWLEQSRVLMNYLASLILPVGISERTVCLLTRCLHFT